MDTTTRDDIAIDSGESGEDIGGIGVTPQQFISIPDEPVGTGNGGGDGAGTGTKRTRTRARRAPVAGDTESPAAALGIAAADIKRHLIESSRWIQSKLGGQKITGVNPATGQPIVTDIWSLSPGDASMAVSAFQNAAPHLPKIPEKAAGYVALGWFGLVGTVLIITRIAEWKAWKAAVAAMSVQAQTQATVDQTRQRQQAAPVPPPTANGTQPDIEQVAAMVGDNWDAPLRGY